MGLLFWVTIFLLARLRISLRQFWLMHNRAWRWAINSASGLFTRLFNGCLSSEKRPGGRQLGSRLSYGSALKTITGESGILLMRQLKNGQIMNETTQGRRRKKKSDKIRHDSLSFDGLLMTVSKQEHLLSCNLIDHLTMCTHYISVQQIPQKFQ